MGKFIISEEERKHIMGLYEQSTPVSNITPESNSEGLKQLLKSNGFQDIYKTNDTFSKTNSNGEEFVFKFPNPQYEVKEHKVKLSVKNPSETTIKEFGLIQNKSYPKYYDDSNNGWLYWEDTSKDNTLQNLDVYKQIQSYISKIK